MKRNENYLEAALKMFLAGTDKEKILNYLEQQDELNKTISVKCWRENKDINLDFQEWGNLRVATKFTNVAKKYFKENGVNAEIIKLYGSIELAPILGLSDVIVDIVSSGKTLEENGLEEIKVLFESTARMIINKVSMKHKYSEIKKLID